MKSLLLCLVAKLAFSYSSAFSLFNKPAQAKPVPPAGAKVLNEIDTTYIMNTAESCIEEECDLEDKEALRNTLDEQVALLERRIGSMKFLSSKLRAKNSKGVPHARDEEIESLMHSIESALSMEFETGRPVTKPHSLH